MHIEKGQKIAGYRAVQIRDFLRKYASCGVAEEDVRLCVERPSEAKALLKRLIADGYLERADKSERHKLTDLGMQFRLAGAGPLLARDKAARMLEDLKKRIEHVNSHAEYVEYVPQIVVFGSFVKTTKAMLGDLDVAVSTARKPGVTDADVQASIEAAARGGVRFRNITERVCWPSIKIWMFLKNRQRGLSLHDAKGDQSILKDGEVFIFNLPEAK